MIYSGDNMTGREKRLYHNPGKMGSDKLSW